MSHGHDTTTSTPPDPAALAHGHELKDAAPSSILVFTISLTITLVVVVAITLGLFYFFTDTEDQKTNAEAAGSPLADMRAPSPGPPIQPSPAHETLPYEDTARLKLEYDRLASSYGSDEMADHKTHDRMPVDAAIKLLASQGIPANTATDIPAPTGPSQSVPTPYSDGGRGSPTGTAAAPGIPQQ
jgi:hypothetical protein